MTFAAGAPLRERISQKAPLLLSPNANDGHSSPKALLSPKDDGHSSSSRRRLTMTKPKIRSMGLRVACLGVVLWALNATLTGMRKRRLHHRRFNTDDYLPPPAGFEHPRVGVPTVHSNAIADVNAIANANGESTLSYPHDDPEHPLHWMRQYGPDPSFGTKKDCNGQSYASLYEFFHREGYVIFESCSLRHSNDQSHLVDKVATFSKRVKAGRAQDAWRTNEQVNQISADPDTLQFLEYLHAARRVFPFQTLNFPRGTQQRIHSDLVHFDTLPTRALMTAVWVALEDIQEGSGELVYYPRSHHWGTWDFDELGLRQIMLTSKSKSADYDTYYEPALAKAVEQSGLKPEIARGLRKGQSFVWAASLLHGGSKVQAGKEKSTRLSQVTHYFFEGADQYWSPRTSNVGTNHIDYKCDIPTCKANKFQQKPIYSCADKYLQWWKNPQDVSKMTCHHKGIARFFG